MKNQFETNDTQQETEMEQGVLGAMLVESVAIEKAIELLYKKSFFNPYNRSVFQAIVALYAANKPIDVINVGEELKHPKYNRLGEEKKKTYLSFLISKAEIERFDEFAQILSDRALRRDVEEIAQGLIEGAEDYQTDIVDRIDWAEQKLWYIADRRYSGSFEAIEFLLSETLEHVERVHNRGNPISGIATGFAQLDSLTSGFQQGDLVILAGSPGVGKTALALDIARFVSREHEMPVAFFSTALSKIQVTQRLLCGEARVDLHKMRTGQLEEEDWARLADGSSRLAHAPIYINDAPWVTDLEIKASTRRLHREHGLGMVVIDDLHSVKVHRSLGEPKENLPQLLLSLKELARELNVPVLELFQWDNETCSPPNMMDLRKSGLGVIEKEVDIALLLHRNCEPCMHVSEEEAQLIVGKQRNGPVGVVELQWDSRSVSFAEKIIATG
jgi:replicative DNA helicase